jgi:diaminopimelate epimerase
MSAINFVKMNGAGNDFIIIDSRINNQQFGAAQIAKTSNRKNIGCDQFIVLRNSIKSDIFMDIYNSDGSKAGACGNATRCVASLIMEEKKSDKINVETISGILECSRQGALISVNMGKPKFDWQEIPLSKEVDTESFKIDDPLLANFRFSALNMGNPHVVAFIDKELDDETFLTIGPKIENYSLFPEKTNVEFVQIIAPNHLKVRVWERGVGETLACGTGACAVAVLAIKKGLIKEGKIQIGFKGGDLFIEWLEDNSVIMTGSYQKVFTGVVDEKFFA